MDRTRIGIVSVLVFGLLSGSAWAQFADTEISGPGTTDHLRVSEVDWTWESVAGVTYTLYRTSDPGGVFDPFADGILNDPDPGRPSRTLWPVDPAIWEGAPLLYYLVTGNDGAADNLPGRSTGGDLRSINTPARCVAGGAPLAGGVPYTIEPVRNFNQPMFLTGSPGDPDRVYVLERPGRVVAWNLRDDTVQTFLDIPGGVYTNGEAGLLGFALHPNWPGVPMAYLHYSVPTGDCAAAGGGSDHCGVIASVEAISPDQADPATLEVMLEIPQPFSNHNGGWIGFGPDDFLYIALGDGGFRSDPLSAGQDLTQLLASMLRISVSPADPNVGPPDCAAGPYGVPLDNPFNDGAGGDCDEIWALGLRNPWRNGFDRRTGDLYIGDVGQECWEEVSVAPATDPAGWNFGWSVREGNHCFDPNDRFNCTIPDGFCDFTGMVGPAYEYDHGEGCSVTGGYVYRGCRMQALADSATYFFGEFCSGWVRTFELGPGGTAQNLAEPFGAGSVGNLVSFGEDGEGELYVLSLGGTVYRLTPQVP